jgi:hypothetical protein
MKYSSVLAVVCISFLTFGQSQFQISDYKLFLQHNKDMSSSSLYGMYDAGTFRGNISTDFTNAKYSGTAISQYSLTDYEKSLINQNGFVVSQRLTNSNYVYGFNDVWQKDMPVFISTDAILHSYHASYDKILKDFEINFLCSDVSDILNAMEAKIPALEAKYQNLPEMKTSLKDVDVYLTVPRTIFSSSATPYYSDNNSLVAAQLSNINAYQAVSTTLFSETPRTIDYSQFKPRGHYDDDYYTQLRQYFKVMMWLGRIEIYLLAPKSAGSPSPSDADIKRQTIDAYLIKELIDVSNTGAQIAQAEDFLKFFIGDQDNVTLTNLDYLQAAVHLQQASDLLDSTKLKTFQDTLKTQSFAGQKILSQILLGDPMTPDQVVPASSFLLFGQRFVIDSYVTASVVYDKIGYQGAAVTRMLPSSLDVLFALGNNAAGQLLQSELDTYHYSANMAALKYLINSYDDSFWNSTLYNCWLSGIRTLNPPKVRASLPAFMQSAAYWQEKANTQLASWAELRHDNLLYAKQSYSAGTTCSYPYAYVEPFPALYEVLKNTAALASKKISTYTFANDYQKSAMLSYYSKLYATCDTLKNISLKELAGTALTDQESNFLKNVLYLGTTGCALTFNGWYPDLYYGSDYQKQDFVVADYHTAPTDAGGNPVGWVKHAGTGPIEMGFFVVPIPNVGDVTCVGPVSTFYEYTTTNFNRLTDNDWQTSYLSQAAGPSFVNAYLADASGASRGDGLKLVTGTTTPVITPNTNYKMVLNNYPNPFNSTTLIHFSVPADVGNERIELSIYDINGQLVDRIFRDPVPSGNYVIQWSPKSKSGTDLSSGVYICQLQAGSKIARLKISYLK